MKSILVFVLCSLTCHAFASENLQRDFQSLTQQNKLTSEIAKSRQISKLTEEAIMDFEQNNQLNLSEQTWQPTTERGNQFQAAAKAADTTYIESLDGAICEIKKMVFDEYAVIRISLPLLSLVPFGKTRPYSENDTLATSNRYGRIVILEGVCLDQVTGARINLEDGVSSTEFPIEKMRMNDRLKYRQ